MPVTRDEVEGRWHLRRANKMSIALQNHAIFIFTFFKMTVKANYDDIYLFSLTNVMPIRIAKCTFFILIARSVYSLKTFTVYVISCILLRSRAGALG